MNLAKEEICDTIVTIPPHGCNSVVSDCRRILKPTTMKKFKKQNHTKVALFAGATALMALTPNIHAQSAGDALVDKLEQKGILSADEAKQLREENKQDFSSSLTNNFDQAFDKATGTPDYVTGYK